MFRCDQSCEKGQNYVEEIALLQMHPDEGVLDEKILKEFGKAKIDNEGIVIREEALEDEDDEIYVIITDEE